MCEDAPCCGCCGNDDYGYGDFYAEDFYDRQESYEAYYDDEEDEEDDA